MSTIGSIGAVAEAAKLQGVTVTADWIGQLAAHTRSAAGLEGIDAAVDRWASDIGADDRLAGIVYESQVRSWMGAQLVVRAVELDADEPGAVSLEAARAPGDPFLVMPFDDAVRYFASKRVISPAEFRALQDGLRDGAFSAQRLATQQLRQRAKDAILASLNGGLTLDEAAAQIRDGALNLGIEPQSAWYLDTVVRSNVASAYGAGKDAAQNDPVILAARPFLQYLAAGDFRVRDSHRRLHLMVFKGGSDVAAYYRPPNQYGEFNFNCRCTTSTLSARQVEQRGLVVTTERI